MQSSPFHGACSISDHCNILCTIQTLDTNVWAAINCKPVLMAARMVAPTYNSGIGAGGPTQFGSQPGLHGEFQARRGDVMGPCLKNKKTKNTWEESLRYSKYMLT